MSMYTFFLFLFIGIGDVFWNLFLVLLIVGAVIGTAIRILVFGCQNPMLEYYARTGKEGEVLLQQHYPELVKKQMVWIGGEAEQEQAKKNGTQFVNTVMVFFYVFALLALGSSLYIFPDSFFGMMAFQAEHLYIPLLIFLSGGIIVQYGIGQVFFLKRSQRLFGPAYLANAKASLFVWFVTFFLLGIALVATPSLQYIYRALLFVPYLSKITSPLFGVSLVATLFHVVIPVNSLFNRGKS